MSIKIIKPAVLDKFGLGDSVYFQGTADHGITTVKLFAEQYLLSTIAVTDGNWAAAYPFNRAGKRHITARGYDTSDRDLAQDTIDLIVNDDNLEILGIDVSNINPPIDWLTAAKTKKVTFAFAKASEGGTWKDSDYATNWAGMKAAGIIRGAYHFFRPIKSVDEQVANFLAMVGKLSPGDLPPVLDLENFPDDVKQQWESITSVNERISRSQEWLEKVEAKLGKKPIIYTGPSFWAEFMDNTEALTEYPLWIANYKEDYQTSKPIVPGNNWGGKGYTFWQFTERGSVMGVKGVVDRNIFKGNLSKLLDLTDKYSGSSSAEVH
jgi:lysozyme